MQTLRFEIESAKLKRIDELAAGLKCSRTEILNEAIDHYLSVQDYHREQIERGLEDAAAGRLVPHEEVVELVKTWSKRSKKVEGK